MSSHNYCICKKQQKTPAPITALPVISNNLIAINETIASNFIAARLLAKLLRLSAPKRLSKVTLIIIILIDINLLGNQLCNKNYINVALLDIERTIPIQ